jgi:hypothetical protein
LFCDLNQEVIYLLDIKYLESMKKLVTAIGACILMTSCASPEVISAGPDTYTVTSGASAGFSSVGVRAEVYKSANKFCQEQGLVMVPVSMDATEGALGRHPPSATLVFRALKPGDPDIKRVNVEGPNSIQRIQER